MKKSMKSFKAINENKKQTVKGGINIAQHIWRWMTQSNCKYCGGDNFDH